MYRGSDCGCDFDGDDANSRPIADVFAEDCCFRSGALYSWTVDV
ncbi:hypothetical protein LMQOC1_30218 [Listeria monocytogenes QOC1]|nr:hypothetical protein LMQOC1_30218 [Listeria monocytogenes QOC1]